MKQFNNVLLVEDDPITVLVCERIIKMTGFAQQVRVANNGQEALDFLQEMGSQNSENLPELIFLDINMPVMNGWEFLQKFGSVQQLFTHTPDIYILSSTVDPEDFKRAQQFAIVKSFISKPLVKEHLEEIQNK
ncbi:MAG: response regulator [Bacteroidetes bacterium]|jgi:CheY-like chemotaxis protein|nr:MAG: response regulator [Bacteroidota bacterium]TAE63732.1 MAG: response regulator [Bacteroidota bacterium]TAF91854.1 MAG: response regulator [Bacteroidota bacterium]